MTDAAQLFIVRYERNATEEPKKDMKPMKTPFQAWHNVDADPASTLVAKYNGSSEISEVRFPTKLEGLFILQCLRLP